MAGIEFPCGEEIWDPSLAVFIGDAKERYQEGYEPAVTLLDLFMGELFGGYSKRALKDQEIHLKGSLVHPWNQEVLVLKKDSLTFLVNEKQRQCLTFYWKGEDRVHSLVLEAKKGQWSIDKTPLGWDCIYQYDEEIPGEVDSVEWAFYLDSLGAHQIRINQEKATLFHPEEEVSILSEGIEIFFQVEVDPSQGLWTGHIAKGDRSYQIGHELPYGGYDWKLGWRTIKRQSKAQVKIRIKVQEK